MSNFLWKIFEKKKSRGYNDNNQSMIDLIFENSDPNESFRSQQPHVDRSMSLPDEDWSHPTERLDSLDDLSTVITSRTNIASVFNTPKQTTLVEELYNLFQDQILDQLGEIINPQKKLGSSPKLLKIQEKDFEFYVDKIKKAFDVYKKNNNYRLKKMKSKEQINITGSLMKCYDVVPSEYFENSFVFNFEYFTREKQKIGQLQEKLVEYLDHVELNLYYQITSRFQEFLDVILKLNQMEYEIHNCIYNIKFFRSFNKEIKSKCADKVTHVLKLKRRKLNIEKTKGLLEIINVVQNTLPAIIHLIQQNNFKYAVELVKSSEETYKSKLKPIKALKNFHTNFTEARATLEKMLTLEFEERCINYMGLAFGYSKNKTIQPNLSDISGLEDSLMNISVAELEDKSNISVSVPWSMNEFKRNDDTESNIAKIVLEFIKIKDFPLTVYKSKILEIMKKFHKQFVTDVNEHNDNLKKNSEEKGEIVSPFDLNIRFALFYLELFKRFLVCHFELVNKVLRYLVEYYDQTYPDQAEYPGMQILDPKTLKNLTETVNEFYLTLAMLMKFFNERMSEIISMVKIEAGSVDQFSKVIGIFEEIGKFFQSTMKIEEILSSWIVTERDTLRKPLYKMVTSLMDKISLTVLQNLRNEIEKNFISNLQKQSLELLRFSFEAELWAPSDIPYDYNHYFAYVLGNEAPTSDIQDSTTENFEDVLKSTKQDINDLEVVRNLANLPNEEDQIESTKESSEPGQDKPNLSSNKQEIFSINRSDVILHKKRYKATNSFLQLLKLSVDYLKIAPKFKHAGMDLVAKLFELIKTFNSLNTQFVLGAGALTFGKIKKITAKILGIIYYSSYHQALSLITLHLLIDIIDPLHQKIELKLSVNKDWLGMEVSKLKQDLNHNAIELNLKIRTILKSKYPIASKSDHFFRIVENCADLAKINWANAQEKITIPTKPSASILSNIRNMYRLIEDLLLIEHLVTIFSDVIKDLRENFIPVFEGIHVESLIAAKRIKEELKYFKDDLFQIEIFQNIELKFSEFEDRLLAIIEDKCAHLLEVTSIN